MNTYAKNSLRKRRFEIALHRHYQSSGNYCTDTNDGSSNLQIVSVALAVPLPEVRTVPEAMRISSPVPAASLIRVYSANSSNRKSI